MRIQQILESVDLKRTLNPALWDGEELNADVRNVMLKIAQAFIKHVGVDLDVQDITLTGSNANYTWNDFSDCDLHIVVPGVASEEERELYSAKKDLWTANRDIKVKGVPVECYVQGAQEPHHSTGVYSVLKDTWVDRPRRIRPRVNDSAIEAKMDDAVRIIRRAILTRDLDTINTVKTRIRDMRSAGLERAGEWSTENQVFKRLRNLGMIDRMAELARELEDRELSLETWLDD